MSGEHPFLIRGNDADGDAALRGRNEGLVGGVPLGIELEAEELHRIADAVPDHGRVFPDTSGENECIEPGQNSGEGPEVLAHLIAKQAQGLGGTGVR